MVVRLHGYHGEVSSYYILKFILLSIVQYTAAQFFSVTLMSILKTDILTFPFFSEYTYRYQYHYLLYLDYSWMSDVAQIGQ